MPKMLKPHASPSETESLPCRDPTSILTIPALSRSNYSALSLFRLLVVPSLHVILRQFRNPAVTECSISHIDVIKLSSTTRNPVGPHQSFFSFTIQIHIVPPRAWLTTETFSGRAAGHWEARGFSVSCRRSP